MKTSYLLFAILTVLLLACRNEQEELAPNLCKTSPAFVKRLAGFNPAKSWFSTSEIRTMGLVLVENQGSTESPRLRYFQLPSWKTAGWLSPIQLDDQGNLFTAPAPFINVLNNPVEKQNTVYKVDANSGEMKSFLSLPLPDTISSQNPYGIIGIDFLCDASVLYVSSIAGSDRRAVRGVIFAIDARTGKIIDELHGYDAMGLGVAVASGKRQLIFGTGRSSELYSVNLDSEGRFSGEVLSVINIAGLGPRGDDKVRKITINGQGHLLIHGIEFSYNLIAPREKQETIYEFYYDANQQHWIFMGIPT